MKPVQIVEVGPRDGFQSVALFIPTRVKIEIVRQLYHAGVRRMEATSFVSAAVPQLADAAEILAYAQSLDGLDVQVLVPTEKHAQRALDAGARHLAFVLSVSAAHNLENVRRSPEDSVLEYNRIVAMLPARSRIRLNLATAFDCPYGGLVEPAKTLALLKALAPLNAEAEIALCDTTGRANPRAVGALFEAARSSLPHVRQWAFHGHDTYGLGAANAFAAWSSGASAIDASVAGLGGCPFAPGATGNVATEDLVWMFEAMGVPTGIDLSPLLATAQVIAALPGAQTGGRVRDVLGSPPVDALA